MEQKKLKYINLINSSLRDVNRENLERFDFSKKDMFKKIKNNFLENLHFDLFDTFYQYIDLIIEYVLEIRKEDCFEVFADGFVNGIEFERYLKDKYEKIEQ